MTVETIIEKRPKRDSTASIGNTEIVAVQGDITQQEVDAIVNSANTWMALGGRRSVAGAIIRKTGRKVLNELAKIKKPVNLGDVIVTPGFNLPCQYIFHVATHGTPSEERIISYDDMTVRLLAISNGISNVIKKATQLKIKSLAMPLLATGSLGYSSRIVIECMLNSLQEGLQKKATLKEVRVVVLRGDRWEDLRHALMSKFVFLASGKILKKYDLDKPVWQCSQAISNYDDSIRVTNRLDLKEDAFDLVKNEYNRAKVLEAEIFNLREEVRTLKEANSQLIQAANLATTPLLPLPIAFAVSMVNAETKSALRVENLRRAFSIFIRYIAVIGMAEYAVAGAFSEDLNSMLREIFHNPVTDGSWLKISAEVAKEFSREHKPKVVEEYSLSLFKEGNKPSHLYGILQGLLKLRNEIHESCWVDETSVQNWLQKAEPLWNKILKEATPLLQYQLVFVEDLLDFCEDDPNKHQYQIRWLMGEFFVPRAEVVEWRDKLKKGRLFLKHPSRFEFLPLNPFMMYEHCQITKAREASCIEEVTEDKVSFSTFRFPYKWQDKTFVGEVKKLLEKPSEN